MRVFGSVSQTALLHNLSIARQYAPAAKLMAVVKKDAYGHGLIRVAKALDAQVDGFAVASIEEAVSLRQSAIAKPVILLSGFYSPEHIGILESHSVSPVLFCKEQLEILGAGKFEQLSAWIKFDTGMNRLGFPVENYKFAIKAAQAIPALEIRGLMTHFACADELDSDFTKLQIDRFKRLAADWQGDVSLANSAGLLRWPDSRTGWVRPGIMLYGASPFPRKSASELGLRPVMNLYSRIIEIKTVESGAGVGYGQIWKSAERTRVGIVAAGYGDGYHRSASNAARVLINNRRADVIGRVSMDSFAVRLDNMPDARVGTPVKLFGEGLPVDELAAAAGTIPYEIFTSLNPRTVSLVDE